MEKPCFRCKKVDHPSNLIGGLTCFSCQEKSLQTGRKLLPLMDVFSSIYKILPILSGIIGLLYLLLMPTAYIALVILIIIAIVFTITSIFGMLPQVFPAFSDITLEEMEIKFKTQKDKYTPGNPSYCIYHSEREAIARCTGCYAPFCAEDFIYILQRPTYCQKCATSYMGEMNLFATFNGIISTSFISGVGIFIEVTNFGIFGLSFIFIILLMILFILVGLFSYYWKKIKSQLPALT